MKPNYGSMHSWEVYAQNLMVEYQQSIEEGKDIASYKPLFEAVSQMPLDDRRVRIADVISEIVENAPQRADYAYDEPSELDEIRAKRPNVCKTEKALPNAEALYEKVLGAWQGRICGCLLGKPSEGIRTDKFHPFLKATANWPLSRYMTLKDVLSTTEAADFFKNRRGALADNIECMPVDDDTNYVVLAQVLINEYGRDFTPQNVTDIWVRYQPKKAYCTAERVAFMNIVNGYCPPDTAKYQNPFREWIGAQIRGDYFGYINPGNPELAAEMAWRDASISHIKNGIYGEMFASAMIAEAAVENDIETIIRAGLAQIPEKSRLYESVTKIIDKWKNGETKEECFRYIHEVWNEHSGHDWCHTISNAMIVAAALLYGEDDFGKSICMAVETGFDTDCNGATVGSIMGMRGGSACISDKWLEPVHGMLDTSIFGVGRVKLVDMAKKTMEHIK